jgi:hypothetical protein
VVQPIPFDDRVDEGGKAEVTRIEVGGKTWWTLAIEAFGTPDQLRPNLDAVARQVLAHPPPRPLLPDRSVGYPEWLQRSFPD